MNPDTTKMASLLVAAWAPIFLTCWTRLAWR